MQVQVLITFQPCEKISRALRLMEVTALPPLLFSVHFHSIISIFNNCQSPPLRLSPLQPSPLWPLTLTFHCRATLSSAAAMQPSLSPEKAGPLKQWVALSQIVRTVGVRASLTLDVVCNVILCMFKLQTFIITEMMVYSFVCC